MFQHAVGQTGRCYNKWVCKCEKEKMSSYWSGWKIDLLKWTQQWMDIFALYNTLGRVMQVVHEGEESTEYIKAVYCTFGGKWDWTWWHRLTHGCQVAQPGLKRVWDMRAEIHELCENKGKDNVGLPDAEWKADLTFSVHVTVHRISYSYFLICR